MNFSISTQPLNVFVPDLDLFFSCFLFFFLNFFHLFILVGDYRGGFCHTLIWISHGLTCVPHPESPSLLPPHPIPLNLILKWPFLFLYFFSLNDFIYFLRFKAIIKIKAHTLPEGLSHRAFPQHWKDLPARPSSQSPDPLYLTDYLAPLLLILPTHVLPLLSKYYHQRLGCLVRQLSHSLFFFDLLPTSQHHLIHLLAPKRLFSFCPLFSISSLITLLQDANMSDLDNFNCLSMVFIAILVPSVRCSNWGEPVK